MNKQAIYGAAWMTFAGLSFTVINASTQWLAHTHDVQSTTIAFFQYLFALLFMLPYLLKQGMGASMRTEHLWQHVLRIVFSVVGIQCWIMALAWPIPIWQGMALLMISPLFATIGAALYLKERVTPDRWLATLAGFGGALIILEPWSEGFTLVSLLPVAAAFFWACYSVMVKKLSGSDSPTTMVMYLFVLLVPFNLVVALPTLGVPSWDVLGWLLLLGFFTMVAQMSIAKAYASADASFLQPFDHLKLPMNILAGWYLFAWVPPGRLWLGAAIIIAATLYVTRKELTGRS